MSQYTGNTGQDDAAGSAKTKPRRRVAVIGSGVAGLTAAWILQRENDVTLFEADGRLGGHADTHQVRFEDGSAIGVDTGFIVHNARTYPTLLRLLDELGIETQDSDMSMSVRCDGCGLEYAGAKGFAGLFAQPKSFLRAKYLTMLTEVLAFYRAANALLETAEDDDADADVTLGEFLQAGRFSDYFISHFMTPVVSAVWSCDSTTALEYPARYLLSFLSNHGMLGIKGSPQWRTITGGSVQYVQRIGARLSEVRLNSAVTSLERRTNQVLIGTGDGEPESFDAAVVATHPRQALNLLTEPTEAERDVLAAMPYSSNAALLHTDETVLPRTRGARASWNYRLPSCSAAPDRVLVSYDMTRLQRLPAYSSERFLVSLGQSEEIDPATVIDAMTYAHPQYTPRSLAAQRRLGELGDGRVEFAGAYFGWGFHEDGALSGRRAAERLGSVWEDGLVDPAAETAEPAFSAFDDDDPALARTAP